MGAYHSLPARRLRRAPIISQEAAPPIIVAPSAVQYLKFEPLPLPLNITIEGGATPPKKRAVQRVNSMRRRSWSEVAYKLNPDLQAPPLARGDEQSSPNTSAGEDSDSASEERRSPVLAVTPATFPLLPPPRPEEVISFIDRIKAAKKYFGALSDNASSPPSTAADSCDDGVTTAPTEAATIPAPLVFDLSGSVSEQLPSAKEGACADDACTASEHVHATMCSCDKTEIASRRRRRQQAAPMPALLVAALLVAHLILILPLLFLLPHVSEQPLPRRCPSRAAIRANARQLLPWVSRQPWLRSDDGVLSLD